jgi:hypothetical protein
VWGDFLLYFTLQPLAKDADSRTVCWWHHYPVLAVGSNGVAHALRSILPHMPKRGHVTLIGKIGKPEDVVETAKVQGSSEPKLISKFAGIAGRAMIQDRVKRIPARVGNRDPNPLVAMTVLLVPTSLERRPGI